LTPGRDDPIPDLVLDVRGQSSEKASCANAKSDGDRCASSNLALFTYRNGRRPLYPFETA
jgi:hypothetical protein